MNISNEQGDNPISDGYKKAFDELISQGYTQRKARRYLDSIARRNLKKFIKKSKGQQYQTVPTEDLQEIPDIPTT